MHLWIFIAWWPVPHIQLQVPEMAEAEDEEEKVLVHKGHTKDLSLGQ